LVHSKLFLIDLNWQSPIITPSLLIDNMDVSVPRSCMKDEGRPLGAGLQEQALNHLKLHWLRVIVVSVREKARQKTVSGVSQGDECK